MAGRSHPCEEEKRITAGSLFDVATSPRITNFPSKSFPIILFFSIRAQILHFTTLSFFVFLSYNSPFGLPLVELSVITPGAKDVASVMYRHLHRCCSSSNPHGCDLVHLDSCYCFLPRKSPSLTQDLPGAALDRTGSCMCGWFSWVCYHLTEK